MLNPNCPIHADTAHCKSCYFSPQGKCEYTRIINEQSKAAARIETEAMNNALDSLLRKD